MPLYTPAKRRISDVTSSKFTEGEQENFQKVYDSRGETDNPKYQVKVHHPDSLPLDSPLPKSYQPAVKQSSLKQFLNCPDPPERRPMATRKSSLRFLTSSENLKKIEDKETKKQRKAHEKEERAKQREAKKLLKEEKKCTGRKRTGIHDCLLLQRTSYL